MVVNIVVRLGRPHFHALGASRRVTDLMILDGEEDEALWVILEKRFVCLLWPKTGCHGRLGRLLNGLHFFHGRLGLLLLVGILGGNSYVVLCGLVFFIGGVEVKLLDRRLHFERLDGRGSLRKINVSC